MGVVLVLAAQLRPEAEDDAVASAARAAADLQAAPGVEVAVAGRSAQHLLSAVWLPDGAALEPFASSSQHMNFVMRGLAPVIAGMWSVSIATDRAAPTAPPAALWTFAIPEADGIFEWQVRRQLGAIDALPGDAWAGPTVEERELHRAGGVVLLAADQVEQFDAGLRSSESDGLRIESALAPSLGEAATA